MRLPWITWEYSKYNGKRAENAQRRDTERKGHVKTEAYWGDVATSRETQRQQN